MFSPCVPFIKIITHVFILTNNFGLFKEPVVRLQVFKNVLHIFTSLLFTGTPRVLLALMPRIAEMPQHIPDCATRGTRPS